MIQIFDKKNVLTKMGYTACVVLIIIGFLTLVYLYYEDYRFIQSNSDYLLKTKGDTIENYVSSEESHKIDLRSHEGSLDGGKSVTFMPDPDQLGNQVPDGEDYLFPVHSLTDICEKKGFQASNVNRLCLKRDGTYKPTANCQCEGSDGYCEICYPEVQTDKKGRSVIYNADKID
jgi:hypothetical protein